MVKGKQQAVTIYTPLASPVPARWLDMLRDYRGQRWDAAARALQETVLPPGYEALAALYAARLEEARTTPPPHDWDGATRFDTK